MSQVADARGSIWRRWDPHIHTPGTVLENQFGTATWDEYFTRIEEASPVIEALGITDYASLDRYEEVLEFKAAGRLPNVGLIFPNVEIRLPLLTTGGHPVNFHLLISPEDADHVAKARGFLRKLKFTYGDEVYECSPEDLIRLGRKHKPDTLEDLKALEVGTNQFKATPDALRAALKDSKWATENIIFAVAGSSNDGSSGLRAQDASLEATRVEIEAMSKAIFSSQPAQRSFWLGEGAATVVQLEKKWHGKKACIHGSDAHRLEKVAKPDDDRYTWIKGDTTFESLRQACLEPDGRVIVDDHAPGGALDYETIDSVSVGSAPWLTTPEVALNRGLVAVIGARGSGKTALADLIAFGAGAATAERTSGQSFLRRARDLLGGATVDLNWVNGDVDSRVLADFDAEPDRESAVQYLSQQFVERLCSSEGMTDELVREVERVVFDSHPAESRMGVQRFQDLLALKAEPGRAKRARAAEANRELAERIDAERQAHAGLPQLQKQKADLEAAIQTDKGARQKLVVLGSEKRSARLSAITDAIAAKQILVDLLNRQLASLAGLSDAVSDLIAQKFPQLKAQLQRDFAEASLSETHWSAFEVAFATDPLPGLASLREAREKQVADLLGVVPVKPEGEPANFPPFVADDAVLADVPLHVLRVEAWRLSQQIGLDAQKATQLNGLNNKIASAESEYQKLVQRIGQAEGASARLNELVMERRTNYIRLFEGFDDEQAQLAELYEPLRDILKAEGGTVAKLSFTVRRVVDSESWAARGESLLDLRTTGTFRGKGELLKVVNAELTDAWHNGKSAQVAEAIGRFRETHDPHFREHATASPSDPVAYRKWLADVSEWLNSTEHITIHYGVKYEGVDIEQLSPGTRGIVLLLLYLSLDRADNRPLIIDQPEENLDPKSIFDELVHRFQSTRHRRQIVIVTHNANLVVNTDADQVIVAHAGAHRPGTLPKITYKSGGLENPEIRQLVCDILEGGRRAFEERAKRLRFTF